MNTDPRRGQRVIALVSALGAAQAVAIVTQIGATTGAVGASPFGAGPTATIVTALMSSVFLTVAITVTAVVVTGAAEVVITGQVGVIALRRLLGASATDERVRVSRAIVRRALGGMGVGAVLGYGVSVAVITTGLSSSSQLHVTAGELVPSPLVLIALAVQFAATRAAAWRGTRGVLAVAPVTALRLSADTETAVPTTLAVRGRGSFATVTVGAVLLGLAVGYSTSTPFSVLPAVAGGVVSFVGVISVGRRFVPGLLAIVGRVFGRSLPVDLALRALRRRRERSSRAVLAVAAPVTLVTTFAVGIASFDRAVREHYAGGANAGLAGDVLHAVVTVVGVLTAFLFLTAVVALGNAVSFDAWQRRRETALLRVLGQPASDTGATIRAQSLLVAATAMVVGLVLGVAYGWIGAQCVFGVETPGHVVTPVLPWPVLVGAVVAVLVLTVAASWAPVRAALSRPPIRAYLAG